MYFFIIIFLSVSRKEFKNGIFVITTWTLTNYIRIELYKKHNPFPYIHPKPQEQTKIYKTKFPIQIKPKMSLVTDEIRASASEVYHGDAICQEKSKFLLTEMSLPNGLLPLEDIEECGYVKDTGFVWLKQKKEKKHKFEKIGKLVSYGTEVTATIEKGKIKKLTGVKTKELMLWITLSDITVNESNPDKISFQATSGLYRTFPVSAFQVEDVKKDVGVEKDAKVVEGDVTKETQVKEV